MAKLSKKKRITILKEKFPELYKLVNELGEAIEAVTTEIQDKLDNIYSIEDQLEELKNARIEINEKLDNI